MLRREGLDTSDGPDLHVWLTDARHRGARRLVRDGRCARFAVSYGAAELA